MLASVGGEFQREIVDSGRLAAFLFFVALLATFGFIRTSTWMIRKQVSWWPGNIDTGGVHVHHMVFGIVLLLLCGFLNFALDPKAPWVEVLALLFGIGAGLTLDEFALWVELKDVYWEQEGRKSIDAMIIAGCTAGALVVGFSSWIKLGDEVTGEVFAVVGGFGALGVLVAIVNIVRGRYGWAALSILFWPAGLVGAARPARESSLWARFLRRHKQVSTP